MTPKTEIETTPTQASEKKATSKQNTALTGAVTGENVHFQQTVQKTLSEGVDAVKKAAKTYSNNDLPSQTGFVAEADHIATFNTRKALSRSKIRAKKTPNGTHGDYQIVNGKKVLLEGEIKYYGTADQTETAMRGYGDQQRIGPADQSDEIIKIAKRKAMKNQTTRPKVSKEHGEVATKAGDCITDGKTKSTPRTLKEAKSLTKKANRGEYSQKEVLPPFGESVKLAAKSGAKAGGLIGGGIGLVSSGVGNAKAYRNGEKSGEEAVIDTAKETAVAAGDGAVKGMVGSGATAVAKHAAARITNRLGKRLLGGSLPAVVAIGAIETGKHVVDFARGKIDEDQLAEKAATTVMTSGSAWAGAAVGAFALGWLGPIGAGVGAIGGGIIGSMGMEAALAS